MPLPVPLLPEVIVIQLSLLAAVQTQQLPGVFTATVAEPPPGPKDWVVEEREKLHVDVSPPWVTVKVRPAIVRVPVCEQLSVLAATE